MALPMLMGGADCGPSNALQGLSKRFDQDRGLQQDQFGAGRAGSSKNTFRTHQQRPGPDAEATRFFAAGAPNMSMNVVNMGNPFDLSAMHVSLPQQQQQQQKPLAAWASDFMLQGPQVASASSSMSVTASARSNVQNTMPWTAAQQQPTFRTNSMQMIRPMQQMQQQHQVQQQAMLQANDPLWENASWAQETRLVQETIAQHKHTPEEQDALARTAGMLVESVKDEQNPKFQNSTFLGLMRQLRDKEVVVDGNEMVEAGASNWANDFQMDVGGKPDVKGKGPAVQQLQTPAVHSTTMQPPRFAHEMEPSAMYANQARAQLQQQARSQEEQVSVDSALEDANDAYFRQENADYTKYWSDAATAQPPVAAPGERADWDQLQNDWDRFEATTSGIKAIHNYQFQMSNPYLLGESSTTRNHMMHSQLGSQSFYESVLELEAAVQRSPTDASAWFALGVKQQENEREGKAMQALQRAVDLDPTHLPSWLALAISNTNDANRAATYDAIREWVERNDVYATLVEAYRAEVGDVNDVEGREAKGRWLIGCLMSMARSSQLPGGEIDADVQIALAILLNTNEDYGRAQDCFRTALALRPDDWLLYNRVGATMANSGHAQDALEYYYRALELNPTYIRARYNLGISCINLRRYEEAAQHILDALLLQDSDGIDDATGMNDKRGVVSDALWDSLKTTCLHMQRVDLATMCDRKELQGLRDAFPGL